MADRDEAVATSSAAVTSRGDAIVSPAMARAVAETQPLEDGTPATRTVRGSTTLLDSQGRTAMYAFVFEPTGFVIVSAELQLAPVLAFSDETAVDLGDLDSGFSEWATATRAAIDMVRSRSDADPPATRADVDAACADRELWPAVLDRIAGRSGVSDDEVARARQVTGPDICFHCQPPPPPCTSYYLQTYVPKLLTTAWGQGCVYNQFLGYRAGAGSCHRMYTGCAPTAMGQLLYKHRRADHMYYDFNFVAGPAYSDDYRTAMRALVLLDLGTLAHTDYEEDGSRTYDSNTMATLDYLGYNTTYSSLPYGMANTGVSEITAGFPFLVAGDTATVGHIWVVDGVEEMAGSPAGCKFSAQQPHTYFHHNWGHDGQGNGWYKDYYYGVYTQSRRMITVHPK